MKVARRAATEAPLLCPDLFDWEFRTLAEKRVWFGKFVERLVAQLTGAQVLAVDGRCDICPDLRVSDTVFIETKSCGRSGQFIVYDWRREKESRFEAEGNTMLYAVVAHDIKAHDVKTWMGLVRAFAAKPLRCTIATHHEMTACLVGEPRTFNHIVDRGHGYTRTGYVGGGWRVRYDGFEAVAGHSVSALAEVDGVQLAVDLCVSAQAGPKLQTISKL